MKFTIPFILLAGISLSGCKKDPQTQPKNADTIMASDSMVSGTAQISPDTADRTATVDSSAYDLDSIKNSK